LSVGKHDNRQSPARAWRCRWHVDRHIPSLT
jgi:hypothetical protein